MSYVGAVLQVAAHARGRQLDASSRDPARAQASALAGLIARARHTAFGRDHDFGRIRSVEDFREQVPVRGYAELKPWLQRAFDGERDVIWPGRVPYFGMSSGTTGGNKYLPISMDSVRQQQRGGFDPVAAFLRAGGARDVMDGKAILLGSTPQLERKPSGVCVGDNTGIMARHMPFFVRSKHLPSAAVRQLASWDDKIDGLAHESIDADVRLIAGTPAWFASLFDAVLRLARARGRAVRGVIDVWPRLRLLTGGGVRFEPYRSLIEARLGAPVPYFDVYNATEGGIMGVQDRMGDPAMRLLPDNGVFYELVPVEELGSAAPRRLSIHEAERDRVYALVLSTMSGLFGYVLGDCIRFVETFPHRFLFEGRSAAFLNVCGEHVSQGEIEHAVAVACATESVALADFTVTTQVGQGGDIAARHVFWLECESETALPEPERLAAHIDRAIARGNDDYATHRSVATSLQAPEVKLLARGTFESFMRERGKLGGQNKVPRVLSGEAASLLGQIAQRQPA